MPNHAFSTPGCQLLIPSRKKPKRNAQVNTIALVQPYMKQGHVNISHQICKAQIALTIALKKGAYTGHKSDIL